MVDFNGFELNVYWKKRKIVEVGGNRGGAASCSSFWPTEIDRSHHLNQDQYHQEQIILFLDSAATYAM